tara:strand:- start:500 stop:739 length:240 start_codon:yes stop_codon:yes gene_type:complete|eukprot:scaffold65774_cov61-Phaeocystis_antarctica.AAC.4
MQPLLHLGLLGSSLEEVLRRRQAEQHLVAVSGEHTLHVHAACQQLGDEGAAALLHVFHTVVGRHRRHGDDIRAIVQLSG